MKRVLFGIQLALLILAVVATLLIGSDSEFVLLFGIPPLALSALLLLALIIMVLYAKQFRFLLKVLLANVIVLLIGGAAIFFTGRGYAYYMLRSESDTIPYRFISSRTVVPDSIQAFVVHESLYKRKNMFSSEYVLVGRDEWRSYHNGWIDYYSLELEQKTGDDSLQSFTISSPVSFEIIGMPRDSIFWMGSGRTKQRFDFRDGLIPGDTILLEYISPSRRPDTIMVVRSAKKHSSQGFS